MRLYGHISKSTYLEGAKGWDRGAEPSGTCNQPNTNGKVILNGDHRVLMGSSTSDAGQVI